MNIPQNHHFTVQFPSTKRARLPLWCWLSGCVAAFVIGSSLPGQEEKIKSAKPENNEIALGEDEVIELSPFVVFSGNDVGYRATNTISGTRLNMEIRDLPMPLTVLTQDYIKDTGSTNLREALSYSSGVQTAAFLQSAGGENAAAPNAVGSGETSPSAGGSVNDVTTNTLNIRGYNVPFQQRMGFRVGSALAGELNITLGGLLDSVNTDRVEIVRGPASLLYGLSVISGVVNVIPKKPRSEIGFDTKVTFGSEEFYRAEIEATGPLVKGLNYRLAGSWQDEGDWVDWAGKESQYGVAQLDYSLSNRLNVFLEFQAGLFRVTGIGARFAYDNGNIIDNDFIEKDVRNEWGEYRNWYQESTGDDGRTFRLTGPDTFYERREWSALGNLTLNILENLSLQAGINYSHQESEEFNVNIRTVSNREADFVVQRDAPSDIVRLFDYPLLEDAPANASSEVAKVVRYWWSERPTEADILQARLELNYRLEHTLFDRKQTHNFLVGLQYIKDEIFALTGNSGNQVNQVYDSGESESDPYIIRAVDDLSIIRYNGEALAKFGTRALFYDVWYSGQYAIYQGQYWNDRVTMVAGLRQDRYDTRRTEFERELISVEGLNNGYYGGDNPIGGIRESRGLFDEAQVSTSKTYALSGRITDSLSVYGLVSEGISPNTGQVDGLDRGIAPEKTLSHEVGVKFDFWKGRVSGTISVYEITRENATWYYSFAPDPKNWVGGSSQRGAPGGVFDPSQVVDGSAPLAIGVRDEVFYEVLGDNFTAFRFVRNPDTGRFEKVAKEGLLLPDAQRYIGDKNWFFIVADENGSFEGNPFVAILQDAINREEDSLSNNAAENEWVLYLRTTDGFGNNASNTVGSTVTFEDQSTGVDAQVILAPTDNWQFIINYARTERTAQSAFRMVDAVDQNSGKSFGTPYDIWVRRLGSENFEDPSRASSMISGGPKGQSLYFGPKDTASFWGKYSFNEGALKNLSLMGGVIYTGKSPTAIAFGGSQFAANRYMTPPTEERFQFDAALSYTRTLWGINWRISLNIFNVTDDRESTSEIDYGEIDEFGNPIKRRSVVTHAPRSFRLSLGASF